MLAMTLRMLVTCHAGNENVHAGNDTVRTGDMSCWR